MDEGLEAVLRKKDDGALPWICTVCKELGELVYCDLCKKGFHIDQECLGTDKAPDEDEWVCKECLAAEVECFACKEVGSTAAGGDIVVCSRRDCAKFFHEACLEGLEGVTWTGANEDHLVCPQHSCRACSHSHASKLYKCLLCPVAYHEQCAPDGSHLLEEIPSHCICWRHDSDWKKQPKKLAPTRSVTEVFVRLAVPLVEIDFELPPEVLAGDSDEEELNLRPPRVQHPQPELASSSLQEAVPEITKKVDTGAWKESTLKRKERGSEEEEKGAKKAKEEAGSSRGNHAANGREERAERERDGDATGAQEPAYEHIQKNVWLVPNRSSSAAKERQGPPQQVPAFGSGKKLELHRDGDSEWSVRMAEDAAAQDFLVEYVGEVVDPALCHQRVAALEKEGGRNLHLCQLNEALILDAFYKGNIARFVSRSSQPNCQLQRWRIDGEYRVGLFATEALEEGTPLSYHCKTVAFGAHSIDDFPLRIPTSCDPPYPLLVETQPPREASDQPPNSEQSLQKSTPPECADTKAGVAPRLDEDHEATGHLEAAPVEDRSPPVDRLKDQNLSPSKNQKRLKESEVRPLDGVIQNEATTPGLQDGKPHPGLLRRKESSPAEAQKLQEVDRDQLQQGGAAVLMESGEQRSREQSLEVQSEIEREERDATVSDEPGSETEDDRPPVRKKQAQSDASDEEGVHRIRRRKVGLEKRGEERRRIRASLRVGGQKRQEKTPGEERVERRERLRRAQEDSPGRVSRELRRLGAREEPVKTERGRSASRFGKRGDEKAPNKRRGRPPKSAKLERPSLRGGDAERPSSSHTAQSSPPFHALPAQPVVSASIATSPVPGEMRPDAEDRAVEPDPSVAAAESAAVGGVKRPDDHEETASPHIPWPPPPNAHPREEEEKVGKGRGQVNGRHEGPPEVVRRLRKVPKWGGRRSRYWVPGYPLNWTAASYLQQHNQLPQPPVEV